MAAPAPWAGAAAVAVVLALILHSMGWRAWRPAVPQPSKLPAREGATQCAYELLRAFAGWTDAEAAAGRPLRWAAASGTLLGAMRNAPPGLLQWEHDADVYMPAKDADAARRRLSEQCQGSRPQSPWCGVLDYRGLVDAAGQPCCGFGMKLFHRGTDACELDVLVVAPSPAPYSHAETPWWPPWTPLWSRLWVWGAGLVRGTPCWVIPEDVRGKLLLGDEAEWCRSEEVWEWCGLPVAFFQDEWFEEGELWPARRAPFHDFEVMLPRDPWAVLHRAYGGDCGHVAVLSEHGGAKADLRTPEYAHLRRPADVKLHGPPS